MANVSVCCVLLVLQLCLHASPEPAVTTRNKPNIILILTDDQDVELGSLNFMPKTLRTIRDHGAEFRHAYVTTPMCCPSRSSLLTGMYVHNHHVFTNNDNCSSTQWQTNHETRSFATYLSNAGYRTGFFGKYLNKYNGSYIPPGWREWGGLIMNSKYYNYSINMNGKKIKHGFDYAKDYYSDLIANDSIAFIRQSKKNNINKPIMLTMSFPAPHGPEDSAPQYSHLFFNVTTHHTPSYDFAPNLDKQWILQVTNKMQPIHREFTDLLMTKRLQTLQSVDAAVERVMQELERLDELQNTFVIYTSDHGYHLGQFGLIKGKSFPFEFDVRVPFLARGPGVEAGTVVDDIVLNIDLAPTFLDIAGVTPPPHMDGRSVLPLFVNAKRKRYKWPDTFLIESSGRREVDGRAKPPAAQKIARPGASLPFPTSTEGTNVCNESFSTRLARDYSSTMSTIISSTTHRHAEYGESDEEDVSTNFDAEAGELDVNVADPLLQQQQHDDETLQLDNSLVASKLQRLAIECYDKNLQLPCRVGQKWFCRQEHGRWRKHKCKFSESKPKLFKKCACFTKNGLVYKKVPVNAQRTKRDTLRHVENVMEDIRSELSGLEAVNATLENEQVVNVTLTNQIVDPGCVRMHDGNINCSTAVYRDRKSWRRSREHIDHEIRRLKGELENLKEIRRHLKQSKPNEETTQRVDTTMVNNNIAAPPNAKFVEIPVHVTDTFDIFHVPSHPKKHRKQNTSENGGVPHRRRKNFRISSSQNYSVSMPSHQHRHRHRITTPSIISSTTTIEATTESSVDADYCHCDTEEADEKMLVREMHRRLKEERMRKKARKLRKKAHLEKECLLEKIHCFRHDNDHWRTKPLWTEGPFCFCMNANNNTYNCVRTINATHNLLYCEFVTGLKTYYNLRTDPFELSNRFEQLRAEEKSFLHHQLQSLMVCRGRSCTLTPVHRSFRKSDDFNAARILPLSHRRSSNERNGRHVKFTKSWYRNQNGHQRR